MSNARVLLPLSPTTTFPPPSMTSTTGSAATRIKGLSIKVVPLRSCQTCPVVDGDRAEPGALNTDSDDAPRPSCRTVHTALTASKRSSCAPLQASASLAFTAWRPSSPPISRANAQHPDASAIGVLVTLELQVENRYTLPPCRQ
eukprot:2547893-Rhodomonas_salina.2